MQKNIVFLVTIFTICTGFINNAFGTSIHLQETQSTPRLKGLNYTEILCNYYTHFDQLNDSLFLVHSQIVKLENYESYIQYQFAYSAYLHSKEKPFEALLLLKRVMDEGAVQSQDALLTYYAIRGVIFNDLGRSKEERESYRYCLDIAISLKDSFNIKQYLINVGDTFYKDAQYDSANHYFELALDLEKKGVMDFHAPLYNSLGVISLREGRIEEAISIYNKLIEDNRDSPAPIPYLNLGKAFSLSENYDQAIKTLEEGVRVEKEGNNDGDVLQVFYQALSELYKNLDNSKLAFFYLSQSDSIRKQQKEAKINLAINEFNLNSQAELYKQEIIQNQKEIEKEKSSKNQVIFIFFILTSSILIAMIFVYWFNQRQKKLTGHLLKSKKEITKIKRLKGNKSEGVKNEMIHLVEKYLLENSAYLAQGLTLDKLSKAIKTNRSYLSKAINEHYSMNFNSLINTLRIKKAQEMFSDQNYDKYSIQGISKLVGFKSLSSFNLFFKKVTGWTPSFYRKNAIEINKNSKRILNGERVEIFQSISDSEKLFSNIN